MSLVFVAYELAFGRAGTAARFLGLQRVSI